jgi:acetyl esterase/lipase
MAGKIRVGAGAIAISIICSALAAGPASAQFKLPKIDPDGTVRLPDVPVPYSSLASKEAKANFLDTVAHASPPRLGATIAQQRQEDATHMMAARDRLLKTFDVEILPQKIGGVQTDVVTPKGRAARHKDRVLINLHGGGFTLGARYGGQVEAIPVASVGGYKVVTVDYRMGPENRFPAASEDVAAVYRELLKTYRPENIGIYGCSAGGLLTSQTLAWFQAHDLPTPGAAGVFGSGAQLTGSGDSSYVAAPLMGFPMPALPPIDVRKIFTYFAGADLDDALVSPIGHPEVLKRFPPTLVISGTRDLGLSTSLNLHSKLVALGVESELDVWEAAPHCVFASAGVDPSVPENQQAWSVIAKFFDKHLGARRR